MIITVISKRKDGTDRLKLTPEAPYPWICDVGVSTFSKEVYLGRTDVPENWRDATEEEYLEWERRQNPDEPTE